MPIPLLWFLDSRCSWIRGGNNRRETEKFSAFQAGRNEMINVVVSGACGRMGKLLLRAVVEEEGMMVAGAVERTGHPSLGKDAGEVIGSDNKSGIIIADNPEEVMNKGDILVEFNVPGPTMSHLPVAAEKGNAVIIGTTGFSSEDKKEIERFSSKIPVLFSPNMSVGVNALFRTAGEVARLLGSDYDVEIIETHHRLKKDAPSGTAIRLGEIIADARGEKLGDVAVYGRKGMTGEKKPGTIGIHAVRGGTVSGEHTVIFAGDSERLELVHRAESREVFVRGVIKAIRFMSDASPGLYDMQDVLNSPKSEG